MMNKLTIASLNCKGQSCFTIDKQLYSVQKALEVKIEGIQESFKSTNNIHDDIDTEFGNFQNSMNDQVSGLKYQLQDQIDISNKT